MLHDKQKKTKKSSHFFTMLFLMNGTVKFWNYFFGTFKFRPLELFFHYFSEFFCLKYISDRGFLSTKSEYRHQICRIISKKLWFCQVFINSCQLLSFLWLENNNLNTNQIIDKIIIFTWWCYKSEDSVLAHPKTLWRS